MLDPMINKARFGLQAVETMTALPREVKKCGDDAASRLYYALYHACWAFLRNKNVPFDKNRDGAGYYSHDDLLGKLLPYPEFALIVSADWPGIQRILRRAKELRVQADYRPDRVREDELLPLVRQVKGLVQRIAESK